MRERLTLAFILLTVSALAVALLVRSYTLKSDLIEHDANALRSQALVSKVALEQRLDAGDDVDSTFLDRLSEPFIQLTWQVPDEPPVVSTGLEFAAGNGLPRMSTEVFVGAGSLTVAESSNVAYQIAAEDRRTIIVLLLLGGILAGLLGWLAARQLSAPFRQLATAAELLGRGRFDLELPRSRLPEVRAISQALYGAAGRLQERLSREQDFAEHASHVLRTPLTGLRMELEELSLRDDIPDDALETVVRSLDRIDSMNVVAGELVQLSRRGSLVAGSELPLRELATVCAQRWADTLAETDRSLTAAVEGNLETTYTPGPVEHILDLLLVDVLRRGTGPVRMVFVADSDGNLKIKLTTAGEVKAIRGAGSEVPITQARAVTTALGGRLIGSDPVEGLEILLPRR